MSRPGLPAIALTMRYWQTVTAFGQAAVDQVLGKPAKISPMYRLLGRRSGPATERDPSPDLARSLASSDLRTKYDALVPAELVYEIAGRAECVDDFYADPDGRRVYAADHQQAGRSGAEAIGAIRIPNQEALEQLGAYCLVRAADRGIGCKHERDPFRFPNADGKHGDAENRLLWTIDDSGAHFVEENKPWNSSRGMVSHMNISTSAYFAGEAWLTGPNEMVINSASRDFGFNADTPERLSEGRERYEAAIRYLSKEGLTVTARPFGEW